LDDISVVPRCTCDLCWLTTTVGQVTTITNTYFVSHEQTTKTTWPPTNVTRTKILAMLGGVAIVLKIEVWLVVRQDTLRIQLCFAQHMAEAGDVNIRLVLAIVRNTIKICDSQNQPAVKCMQSIRNQRLPHHESSTGTNYATYMYRRMCASSCWYQPSINCQPSSTGMHHTASAAATASQSTQIHRPDLAKYHGTQIHESPDN
jgi:hypothetical protein